MEYNIKINNFTTELGKDELTEIEVTINGTLSESRVLHRYESHRTTIECMLRDLIITYYYPNDMWERYIIAKQEAEKNDN